MVITRLMGGLGNQMFQYAVGRHLSVKLQVPLLLDMHFFGLPAVVHTARDYGLDVFSVKARKATPQDLDRFKWFERSGGWAAIQRKVAQLSGVHRLVDLGHGFQPEVLQMKGDIYLDGYWQSEKYFKEIEGTIREEFTFREKMKDRDLEIAERIKNCNSVSMHVRRGDYLTNEAARNYYTVCDAGYYSRAVELIAARDPDIHVFVFSDDPHWVRQNLPMDRPITYVEHNINERSHLDMRLMSLCRHNIIANSSFSWWAAWLNAHPGKIVVSPASWFQQRPTVDILPPEWIAI